MEHSWTDTPKALPFLWFLYGKQVNAHLSSRARHNSRLVKGGDIKQHGLAYHITASNTLLFNAFSSSSFSCSLLFKTIALRFQSTFTSSSISSPSPLEASSRLPKKSADVFRSRLNEGRPLSPFINTVGGVANLTGPPACSGTCNCSLFGFLTVV